MCANFITPKFRSFNNFDYKIYGGARPFADGFDPLIFENSYYSFVISGIPEESSRVYCELSIMDEDTGITTFTATAPTREIAIEYFRVIAGKFDSEIGHDGVIYSANESTLNNITNGKWKLCANLHYKC